MRQRTFFIALVLGLAALTTAAPSTRAQSLNYQTFLLGDRALGLGGAFTGLAEDPSAIYYNPAGIARLGVISAAGSLSVSLFESYTVRDGFGSAVGTTDLDHYGSLSVPLFVGLVHKPGSRRTRASQRRHAFGASIIHPGFLDRGYDAVVSDPTTQESASLEASTTDRSNWYGASYAYRLADDWSVGVSAFLAYRTFTHRETEVAVGLDLGTGGGASSFSARQSRTTIDATHLVFRVGILGDVSRRWRVGLMFQPPGFALSDTSAVRERVSRADLAGAAPSATFRSSNQTNLTSELPVPWELRLGASTALRDNLVLAFDLSMYGPAGSGDDPLSLVGQPRADEATGFVPSAGRLVATEAYTRFVVNASVGVEATLGEIFVVRGGLFTDFSPNPEVEAARETYRPADVDYLGASLSLGLRGREYDIAIGAAGLLGWGESYRLSPQRDIEGQPDYLAGTVHANALYFYLTGALSVASRLADRASEEIFE